MNGMAQMVQLLLAQQGPPAGQGAGAGLFVCAGAILITGYLLPTLIAGLRGHHNTLAIFALNILLGWTFVGWVVALVWSLTVVERVEGRGE